MKKVLSATALALVMGLSSAVMAQGYQGPAAPGGYNGPAYAGGFQGPGLSTVTVADAVKMSDDTPVVLEGKIEKSLGKEKYLFKDNSGSVTIEIDNEDWRGQTVTPADTIVIKGEVDKDFFKTEIDVDVVELKK